MVRYGKTPLILKLKGREMLYFEDIGTKIRFCVEEQPCNWNSRPDSEEDLQGSGKWTSIYVVNLPSGNISFDRNTFFSDFMHKAF